MPAEQCLFRREAGASQFTAAFSDGDTLWALRWTSDGVAPTLYAAAMPNGGRCLVSEPFDRARGGWTAVPPASFVALDAEGMSVRPLLDTSQNLALAG